jgi:hypothetical protein
MAPSGQKPSQNLPNFVPFNLGLSPPKILPAKALGSFPANPLLRVLLCLVHTGTPATRRQFIAHFLDIHQLFRRE